MFKLLMFLMIFSLTFPVSSTELATLRAKFGPRGETVGYVEIRVMQEASEKSLVEKGAVWLRNFTQSSGYEGCANICATPDRQSFGMIVASSHSQIGCALVERRCPDHMTPVGRSIHSHPTKSSVVLNPSDREFIRARHPGKVVRQHERHSISEERFSKEDLASGSGYLVTERKIWLNDEGQIIEFASSF